MTLLFFSVGFGCVAWLGALLAERLYGRERPFDDGPLRVEVPPWLVGIVGAVVGIGIGIHALDAARIALLLAMVFVLTVCTVTDLNCGIVPDLFTLVPLEAIVAFSAVRGDFAPLFAAVLASLPFAIMASASRGRGMGWGDVKLAALAGAFLGAGGAIVAFGLACLVAFTWSRLRRMPSRPIAFAPYLATGIAVVMCTGPL